MHLCPFRPLDRAIVAVVVVGLVVDYPFPHGIAMHLTVNDPIPVDANPLSNGIYDVARHNSMQLPRTRMLCTAKFH